MFHVCFNRDVPCPPFSAGDQGQDLFGEGDDDAAGNGHHTVGPLRRVMGLEAEAQLQYAEAQQDDAHGPDQAEDEVAELVHHGDGVPVRKRGSGQRKGQHQDAEQGEQGTDSFVSVHSFVSSNSFSR